MGLGRSGGTYDSKSCENSFEKLPGGPSRDLNLKKVYHMYPSNTRKSRYPKW